WRVKGELWNIRLARVVEPLLIELDDGELDALSALSIAGTVAVPQARERIRDHLLTRLADLGLLQIAETSAGPVAGVFPPLVAEYLRRTGTAVSRLELPSHEGRQAEAGEKSLTPKLSLTSTRAAILNTRIVEHWKTQVTTLRTAWRAEPTVERAVVLFGAMNAASAEPAEFATVIAGTSLDGADPVWAVRFVAWHACYLALLLGDLPGARALLRRRHAVQPDFAPQLRAAEATLQFLVGPIPDAELLVPPEPGGDPLGAESLEVARLATLVAAGRTRDALAVRPDEAPAYPYNFESYRVGMGLARVLHGDLDQGVDWALRSMAEAEAGLDIGEIQAHAYVAALGLSLAGRLDRLDALLGPALTLSSTTMLHAHYQVGVLTLASLAAARQGRMDYSRSLTEQAEATGQRSGPFPAMAHDLSPLLAADEWSWPEAGLRMWRAAEECFAKGHIAAGVLLACTSVAVLPDVARAAAAAGHARSTQSPLLIALGDYIETSATGDPDALAECIAALRACGARLHAVKAEVTRALALRARGQIDASVHQARLAWEHAGALGRDCRGMFLRLGRAVGLTTREREITLMLAGGMGAADIAAALGLSARTVDNYLFSAYRKLGVENRDDLVRAVSTWAAVD
ncbi:MAG: LuxR C-terminal-related transcriptional regulator, partial [Frankiaceae bacterium]|nr:LuxR C-terminal-related transcriptional regulator [Frankiaceae bacterium]